MKKSHNEHQENATETDDFGTTYSSGLNNSHQDSDINDLCIAEIVTDLHALRLTSLEHRKCRDKPPKLPSRKVLQTVVEGLGAALFPNRLGLPDLKESSIDYFVGHTLDVSCVSWCRR